MADHRSPDDEPFASQRPDGKGAKEPYLPPPKLAEKSPEELRAKLKDVERDFYWSRHENRGKSRGELEREWNDLNAELNRRERADNPGKRVKPWVYRHDRRDAFTIETKPYTNSQEYAATRTEVKGQVHDTRTTINWSKTPTGAERHEKIRESYAARGLLVPGQHDLGHVGASEFGFDPEGVNRGQVTSKTPIEAVSRPNYTSQPSTSNQKRGWRTEEVRVRRASRTAPVDYFAASTATEKRGLHREQSRKMEATQKIDGKVVKVADSNLLHAGTNDLFEERRRAAVAERRLAAKSGQQPNAPVDSVEAKRNRSQQLTDARKAKSSPGTTVGTAGQGRSNVVPITQAKGTGGSGPKKSK